MKIRLENEKDYFKVENLLRDSFQMFYRSGAFEHYIVHNLRKNESSISNMAYVIERDGEIMGNINYSSGLIDYGNESVPAIVFGPVAIHEDFQNKGLGSELIEYTLTWLK